MYVSACRVDLPDAFSIKRISSLLTSFIHPREQKCNLLHACVPCVSSSDRLSVEFSVGSWWRKSITLYYTMKLLDDEE